MANITDTIALFNTLTEKNAFGVYVPLLKREVLFKPLTTKQQKSFYACLTDNVVYGTKFVIATFNIITENCLEPEIINQLTVIDRLAILLQLRKNTLGTDITLLKNDNFFKTNIEPCLDNLKNIDVPSNKITILKNIKIELQTPLIVDQHGVEKEIREARLELPTELNSVVEEAILGEVCKLIKNVWVLDGDNTTDLQYNSFTYEEKIALIEKMPAEVLTEAQTYLALVNDISSKILTVSIDTEKIVFNITVDFFLDS